MTPHTVWLPRAARRWLDELVDEADWAEREALRAEALPPPFVDALAAHHGRVLMFELTQFSDWGQARREADRVKRAEARAVREADRAARAQGVGNVVDDPHSRSDRG